MNWESNEGQFIIVGIVIYITIVMAILFVVEDTRDPRKRARYLLCAPIWPLALVVWGLTRGRAIGRLFRAAFQPTIRERITYKG